MSPTEQGRHCEKCSLTVLDFTSKSDEEILNVLKNRSGQRTCGRIRKKVEVHYLPEIAISAKANFRFTMPSRLYTFSLCAVLLAACQSNSNQNTEVARIDSNLVQVDSFAGLPDSSLSSVIPKDSIIPVPKPPKPQRFIDIMGDLIVEPPAGEPVMPVPNEAINCEVISQEDTLHVTNIPAEFPGGQDSLLRFIKRNMVYPSKAKEVGIEGKVIAKFVVTPTGDIVNIQIVKPIPYAPEFDAEVIRVIKLMPKWKPALDYQNKPVHAYYHFPFVFKLD